MKNPSKRITWKEISRQKFLMVCAAIFFVYGIVFYYVPLAGWVMAFQDYKPKDGLFGSKFVDWQSLNSCSLTTSFCVISVTLWPWAFSIW